MRLQILYHNLRIFETLNYGQSEAPDPTNRQVQFQSQSDGENFKCLPIPPLLQNDFRSPAASPDQEANSFPGK